MLTSILVKMQPESFEELAASFAKEVKACQKHLEAQKRNGVFGPESKVTLRYLVITEAGRDPIEIEDLNAEQDTGSD